jgi:PAS domain S-box-containing protein
MVKERREKELPKGKPRGRVKHSSSTQSQRNIAHSHARSPSIQPIDWEERYHALFDRSLQYAIIQDFEGNILDANEMVLKLLGYSREDILHLNIASFLSEDQLPKALAELQELKDTGITKQVNEWRLRRKDGSFVDMLLSGALIYREGKPHAILGIGINITEHKRAEESLLLSEQNFRDSIEKSPLGIRIVTGDGNTLYVNKTLLDICGYGSLEELKAVPRNQLYTPESYAEHRERVNKRKRREYVPSNYEISIVRKDGQVRRLSVSRGEVLWDGEKQSQVAYQDITEHKQAEEALQWSQAQYQDLYDNAPVAYYSLDTDGWIKRVNKAGLKFLGYSREELQRMKFLEIYADESKAKAEKLFGRFRQGIGWENEEMVYQRKNGEKVHGLLWVSPILDENGRVLESRSVVVDVTQRKKAEEALRESEERYRALFDRSLDCIFVHDFEGNFLDANEAALKLLGYDREDISHLNFASLLSQDQLPKALATLQEFKDTGAQKQMNEFGLRRKDGSFVDVEVIGAIIYHEGKPHAVQGVGRDITERKRAEEMLKESEQKYRTILEEMGDGYFETDLAGNLTFVNDAMIRRLGYSKEELIGMNYRALRPKEAAKAVFKAYNRIYKTGEPLRDIFTEIICKDGSHVLAETSAFPIRNGKGEIIGFRGIRRDITERKQAEEALRHSEERYRTILEEMEEGYYEVDLAGTFTFVNDAMSRILGYSRDELIGMNYKIYTPKEDVKRIFQAYNRVYRTGEPLKWFPMPEIRKDGTRILAEDSVFPLRNEQGEVIRFRGISRDVTERRKAEEALRQSEERYRAILGKMEDSYFEVDLAGNLTFVNSSACRLLGYSRGELIRMSYKDFTAEEYIKSVFQVFNEVYRTATPNKGFHWKIIRKDGSPGFIDASVTPLRNDKGEIIGFSGVGRDITERIKMEEQLVLTDRLASIGQLAAGIAHELNNPLTAVIGFSDLLLGRDLPADAKEDLETVNQEARRATNIVKELLAFAREQRTEKSLVDINSIIQGVLQIRSYEQRVSNIEADARFAPALPPVMGNGVQLQQVFMNIIVNAEQAMLEAHKRGKLTIVTERVGDIVRASFTDDGPGISPDNMKQLFTPFFTTREVGKGTGLGLSICHGIVTEHGGKIYAESELGEGATFVVELPISK